MDDIRDRGRLLTKTFKRMDAMGITNAEDIIYQLAQEIEGYKLIIEQIKIESEQKRQVNIALSPADIPEDMQKRITSMDIAADGSVSLYFENFYNELPVSPMLDKTLEREKLCNKSAAE